MCIYHHYANEPFDFNGMTLTQCPLPCREIISESKGYQTPPDPIHEGDGFGGIILAIPSTRIAKVKR